MSNLDELVTERTKIVSMVHQSNILGHGQLGVADRGTCPRGGRTRHARLLAVGSAHAGRRHRPRRRPDRLHRAQDVRADRHRRVVGPLRGPRITSAIPRRRRDDRDRRHDRLDLCADPAQVRGGHTADRSGGRSRSRRRLPVRAGHGERGGPRARADDVRAPAAGRDRGGAVHRPAAAHLARRDRVVHPRRCASARRRTAPRRARSRCPGRPSLRAPGVRPVWNSCDHPSVFLPVHDTAEIDALVDGVEHAKRFFR